VNFFLLCSVSKTVKFWKGVSRVQKVHGGIPNCGHGNSSETDHARSKVPLFVKMISNILTLNKRVASYDLPQLFIVMNMNVERACLSTPWTRGLQMSEL